MTSTEPRTESQLMEELLDGSVEVKKHGHYIIFYDALRVELQGVTETMRQNWGIEFIPVVPGNGNSVSDCIHIIPERKEIIAAERERCILAAEACACSVHRADAGPFGGCCASTARAIGVKIRSGE